MAKKLRVCSICGQKTVELSKDHVPPKSIFMEPRPKNSITVRACTRCNNGSSALDQKFGVYLSLHAANSNQIAEKLLKTSAMDTLNKNKKLTDNIIAGLRPAYLATESGVIYDKADVVLWDNEAYNSIIERTVRGLYFHHYKQVLGNKVGVTVCMLRKIPAELLEFMEFFAYNEIGHQGEFVYKYMRSEENPLYSMWIFQFYNSLFATGTTKPLASP